MTTKPSNGRAKYGVLKMTQNKRKWIWGGRVIAVFLLVGLGILMANMGLTKASALGGAIGLLVAIAALVAPYLIPVPKAPANSNVLESTGSANALAGGKANTGVKSKSNPGSGRVSSSGDATADGAGSVANTGIQD
jgi:hypothetical protein